MEKNKNIYTSFFAVKNNRKHLAIAVKYLKDGENRISFTKDVEITDGRVVTIYSALNNFGAALKG